MVEFLRAVHAFCFVFVVLCDKLAKNPNPRWVSGDSVVASFD